VSTPVLIVLNWVTEILNSEFLESSIRNFGIGSLPLSQFRWISRKYFVALELARRDFELIFSWLSTES
jgi:hypothetical protein